jgi:hypothetical protein
MYKMRLMQDIENPLIQLGPFDQPHAPILMNEKIRYVLSLIHMFFIGGPVSEGV